ncbi:bifunctional homocysteine S-methyltransferase/methylenetetrahydrofolate reductase [Candidatus Sumerlaeota bacterium]|nr:bifunctional homocysteine S-methyltransferase/methylenetetrahydrofolate reductase [Candidatus Sumerlaeota bacterium]
MEDILTRIKDIPVVFDGAMGTMIYSRGVFINTCYDELCLVNPQLILEIHREYVQAGAEAIETNSFGANRIKLAPHGLADRAVEINERAARIARDAAGDSVYVAGSVGPCLRPGQALEFERERTLVSEAFEEQIRALVAGGVDLILLETFFGLDELRIAARNARASGLPVFASFTVGLHGETVLGNRIEDMVAALDADENVDAIGINCGIGPAPAYDALERALPLTRKPFIVMPNAGLPQEVDGRMIYMTSPEYFTEYAKRFIELGVKGVGGCCGTTPEHIRMAARALGGMSGVKRYLDVRTYTPEEIQVEAVAPERKSRLAAKMLRGEKVSCIEIVPPRSTDLSPMVEKAALCRRHGVDTINVPDSPRATSRVSPMIAAIAIQERAEIEAIVHYCCRDRNLIGMQSDLIGGYAAGLHNFLIITGDPPKIGDYPDATGVFDVDSVGLARVVWNLNHGRDIGGSVLDPPTGLFVGVGANPCAVEMRREMERFRRKIDSGAEFAVTQPVWDTDALLRFLDTVSGFERPIPIVAGIWPLVSFKNAEFLHNEVPGVTVPDAVMERMRRCSTKQEGTEEGIAIAREIVARVESCVAGFQVSAPFGRVETALRVLGRID